MHIRLPNQFTPRPYQRDLFRYFDNGGKRAVLVWHRRAGKDMTMLHQTAKMAMQRVGTYLHVLPEQAQARKVIWDAIDIDGLPLLDTAFPAAIVKDKNISEMKITLKNGSIFQLGGSDNYNSMMGTNPIHVTFSEYSIANPSAWDYIRPILAVNGGTAAFIYTPRGRNHGYQMMNMAMGDPDWFCSIKTVNDTNAVSQKAIQDERKAGMSEDMIQQEFYCSFTSGALGSYYGKLIEDARQSGRITNVPYNPALSTEYWFDLGYNDYTSCWVVQRSGYQYNAIRFHEWGTTSLPRICAEIREWGYRRDLLILPHDGDTHELIAGRTRKDVMEEELGCMADSSPRPQNMREKLEQIHAVRSVMPMFVFDATLCEHGLFALESYTRKWDEKNRVFMNEPKHDWASHCADAMRTGAVMQSERQKFNQKGYSASHRVKTSAHGTKGGVRDDDWLRDARMLD